LRQGAEIAIQRWKRAGETVGQELTSTTIGETDRQNFPFRLLVQVLARLAIKQPHEEPDIRREAFTAAQWAQTSEAAASLAQMAARNAKDDSALGRLVRERQDLLSEWRAKEKLIIAAHSKAADQRRSEAESALTERVAVIDARRAEIDETLKKDFPEYAALVNPEPLSVQEIQAHLRENEVLAFDLDAPEETFIWLITKSDLHWARSPLGTKALTDKVQALRCGLDDAEWDGIERPARCAGLLNVGHPGDKEPLPFSFAIAHELYGALLGHFSNLIKDKHLLVVPSGPITSLPIQVLVAEPPKLPIGIKYESYRDVAWLGSRQAITILPSVTSLNALRAVAKASEAPSRYVGFGNPTLNGSPECRPQAGLSEACPTSEPVQVASTASIRVVRGRGNRRSAGVDHIAAAAGYDVIAQVKSLCPLPDTAQEIRCVAKSLGVAESEVHLNSTATESNIKELNQSGKLATYRVVHFATHGLLAGDVEAMAKRRGEPALVLTPPETPSNLDDDGLLTASEVTQLKLNADWVVLSACNTAAGEKLGAEAFSGLARAFFYAGTRTMLVSHWPVYSDAAVRLITGTFDELEAHPEIGRAEAQKRAMVALMRDSAEEDNPHPSVWAPFVVVGEGAN
jgi:CHAT domain-containing protein